MPAMIPANEGTGTNTLLVNANLAGPIVQRAGGAGPSWVEVDTAGPATYVIGKIWNSAGIRRDPAGGNRTDTLPTAVQFANTASLRTLGDSITFAVLNVGASNTVTLTGGTGITDQGTLVLAAGAAARAVLVRTSEAEDAPTFDLFLQPIFEFGLTGPVAITGSLSATTIITAADLTATDDLVVGDDAAISGALTVGETAAITGNTTVGGTLGVTGATTVARILATGLVVRRLTTANVNTAGDVTVTAAQVLGGRLTRDPNGGNRSDTLCTGTELDTAGATLATGDTFSFTLDNTADAAETITLGMGVGLTNRGSAITIAQNTSAVLEFVKTGVATYNVYRLA